MGLVASLFKSRSITRFHDPDTVKFLQGLLTNDPQKLQSDMESNDDFHLLPPSLVHYRKLKRLKKETKFAQNSRHSASLANFSEPLEDLNGESGP
ncbi:hypothetical protein RJT34_09752 [Clitoria ternatea]|uniref:Uncharacterized protein n=1 Tax=Clitoria ternatea TaxID=43366 RepID=A0AAN9PTG1_CLITE